MMDPGIENSHKNQFSIRAIMVLMAACAGWLWILAETSPAEMAIFTAIAIFAGVVSHIVYAYWLPWRITVIAIVLVTYNLILFVIVILWSNTGNLVDKAIGLMIEVVVQPVEMLTYASTLREMLFLMAILLGTLVFAPTHAYRPSLPAAITTALGIGIWYAAGFLMMMHAG